jgi:type IV secretion system protein VirD4
MQLPSRAQSFMLCLLLGTCGIWYWCYAELLPKQFHFSQPIISKTLQLEGQSENNSDNSQSESLPWFCTILIEEQCTLFLGSSQKTQSDVLAAGFAAIILTVMWLGIVRRMHTKIEQPNEQVLGSAGFATIKELKKAQKSARGSGTVVLGKVGRKLQSYNSDKHVLMIVANRSGKGVSYILPSLLSYPGSVFVTDPKGENASISAKYRATLGKVCVIDPWGVAQGEAKQHRTTFNPLHILIQRGEGRLYADAQALAGAMIVASGDQRNDHWNQSAEQLLMHNFFPEIDPETKEGSGTSTLERMMANPACNNNIAAEAAALWNTPENERGGIISSARKQTQFLDEPHLAQSLRDTESQIDFSDWKSGVMSCYLCAPAPYVERYARWLRVVITSAMDSMIRELSPPPLPVQFILDELAFLGRLPVVEASFGLSAGYGVQVWAIFQDVGQMRDLYKERAPTFWNNAGVRVAFAAHDHDTAEYIGKHLGTATVTTTSVNTTGQSYSQHARPLLNPDEVSRTYARETGKALIFLDSIKPLEVNRVLHFVDEPFRSRAEKIEVDEPRNAKAKQST